MTRLAREWTVCLVVLVCASSVLAQNRLTTDVVDGVAQKFANVRTMQEAEHTVSLYGAGMSKGASADRAAFKWLEETAPMFTANGGQLQIESSGQLGTNQTRTIYNVRQFIDGLPVANGVARMVVNGGIEHEVTYFGGKLAEKPAKGFQPVQLTADAALNTMKSSNVYADFDLWTQPVLQIHMNPDTGAASRVWSFMGGTSSLKNHEARSFHVDAATGALVASQSEVYDVDVTGMVTGLATPGTFPDTIGNPPMETPLPEMSVSTTEGGSTFTDLSLIHI